MKCHKRKCGNSREEMTCYFQILASETAAWRVSSGDEPEHLFWISCPYRHEQESTGPADHYKPLYLLQKSHGLLGIRTNKCYCCLSTYILYVTYVLCTNCVTNCERDKRNCMSNILMLLYLISILWICCSFASVTPPRFWDA